jgi:nitroreductase
MRQPPRFLLLDFERLNPDEQRRRSDDFLSRIATRRTVRDFSEETVPWEIVRNAVRAAATAPSGANRQPWRFIVISDPAIRREIRLAAEAEEKDAYPFADGFLEQGPRPPAAREALPADSGRLSRPRRESARHPQKG